MHISFIGGGAMAEAIIGGTLSGGIAPPEDIGVSDVLEQRRSHLKERYGVTPLADNRKAVAQGDLVILAIKPQNLPQVMAEIKGTFTPGKTAISIVAGARMSTLTAGLEHQEVIRVMPNTPAQVGVGMSVWMAAPEVKPQAVESARAILKTLGEELYVTEEKYLDMATALSASGPAYVFTFAEALIDAGVYLGLPRDMATKLVLQTLLGSTVLMQKQGKHPAELRDMVTSPGGTTAEALRELEKGSFRAIVIEAVAAAYKKSKALGGQR